MEGSKTKSWVIGAVKFLRRSGTVPPLGFRRVVLKQINGQQPAPTANIIRTIGLNHKANITNNGGGKRPADGDWGCRVHGKDQRGQEGTWAQGRLKSTGEGDGRACRKPASQVASAQLRWAVAVLWLAWRSTPASSSNNGWQAGGSRAMLVPVDS